MNLTDSGIKMLVMLVPDKIPNSSVPTDEGIEIEVRPSQPENA